MTIILAPGQGAQKAGMLSAWMEVSELSSKVDAFSEITGLDIRFLGTQAETSEITDTAIAQPLIVVAGILSYSYALAQGLQVTSDTIVSGHSIGEITAAVVAGVLSEEDAVYLASQRGSLMAQACQEADSSMAALLGGNEDEVVQRIEALGLTPANFNAQGQIVAAGSADAIAALAAEPPSGARVRPLAVAGAFHSPFMRSAQQQFEQVATKVTAQTPRARFLSNKDGKEITSGEEFLTHLVAQLTSPVRWTDITAVIATDAPEDDLVELAPAGTLIGIAKRELKQTQKFPYNSPEEVQKFFTQNTTT